MSDDWPEYIAAKPDKTWSNMPYGQTYVHIRRHMLISGNLDDAKKRIAELEAQLAQRDAALKAADDLAINVDSLAKDLDRLAVSGGAIPVAIDALAAYRKARGQDA